MMGPHQTRARHAAPGLLLAATLFCACTPISERASSDSGQPELPPGEQAGGLFAYSPNARRLEIGEIAPDTALHDHDERALTLSTLRGSVLVLAFVGASGGNDNDAELMRRLAEFGNTVRPALAEKIHLLTLVLDEAADSAAVSRAQAAAPTVNVPWTFLGATPADAGRLATAFGVAVWQYGDGSIGHSFNTVIIDPAGRFVDQFPGLDPWSPRDLVAAAGAAAGH